EEKKKRMAKMQEEMKEYEEMRKEEREKLEAEISDLRAKREQRKQERAEEEKRLAELRAIEEQKRRAEEEERQRRKREEEARRQEEREKKKREAEERSKSQSQRNFTISKKSGSETGPTDQDEAKQGKSKEQLEAEKKAALEQRVQPLNIDGFGESQLQEKAKELFNKIYSLEGDKYDLEQRFKALNMEPKIIMYSQYERVKDRRDFGERQELFKGPIYGVEYERIPPSSKVIITEQGPRVVGEIGENDNDQGHNQEGDEPVATEE
uniref:Troponin t skeletal muscle n=1 Tax=Macrostomum lignano TaxID=282301 RepID=A0A1I8H6E0_9PLAT